MTTKQEIDEWIVDIRAEAEHPDADMIVVRANNKTIVIFAEDVTGKSNNEIFQFITQRLKEGL
jgi:hypothetical protein